MPDIPSRDAWLAELETERPEHPRQRHIRWQIDEAARKRTWHQDHDWKIRLAAEYGVLGWVQRRRRQQRDERKSA
jgi:hypothetical protein